MSSWHSACEDCVLNSDCLLQDGDDVESCDDVQKEIMDNLDTGK